MSEAEIRKQLKAFLTTDLANVFILAKRKVKRSSSRYKEVILLESRFNKIEDDQRIGTITNEFYNQTLNTIRANCLDLIDKLKKNDLSGSYVNKKSLKRINEKESDFENRLKYFGQKRKLKSVEGKEIYQTHFDDFIVEFEAILKKYCEIGQLNSNIKLVKLTKVFQIEMATVKIMPCVDNTKRYLWIALDFDGKKNKKSLSSMGEFKLEYSKDLNLVWQNFENKELNFTNKQLAEITIREVIELIIQEE